jgi:hypothetical protein
MGLYDLTKEEHKDIRGISSPVPYSLTLAVIA